MIRWEKQNGVGIATFDSPHGNMIDIIDLQSLKSLLSQNVESLDGIILIGKDKVFCTGMSIDPLNSLKSFQLLDEVLLQLYSLEIPLVVALSGHCIGAGFLMLCCADYVISVDNERMKCGLPEIKLGLGLDQMMTFLLLHNLPYYIVKKLLYSGDYVSFHHLQTWGIIDKIVSQDSLMEQSMNYLKDIHSKKSSFIFCKRQLRRRNQNIMHSLFTSGCYKELFNLYINL